MEHPSGLLDDAWEVNADLDIEGVLNYCDRGCTLNMSQYDETTSAEKVLFALQLRRNMTTIENSNSALKNHYENGFNFMLDAINSTDEDLEIIYSESNWGPYITSIGGYEPTGNSYWALSHNGAVSLVGIGDLYLESNSVILWEVATY